MKKLCAVVIPIYKETLDCVEKISLQRLNDVLGLEHDVYFIIPKGMNIDEYSKIFIRDYKVSEFDPSFFKSTATYSQLCVSYDFYKTYIDYEYMLIYQLDCYLFRDEITQWCLKGYDYVGGPIISTDCGWDTVKESKKGKQWTPYVGNGGLSLRKISTFLDILDPNGVFRKYTHLTDEQLSMVVWEDKFFCNDLYNLYELNIPDWFEAANFALDMSVDIVYNYFKLDCNPMGIHSVDKNIRWWKNHITEFSNPDVVEYCENKHKDFFNVYYDENDSTLRTHKT